MKNILKYLPLILEISDAFNGLISKNGVGGKVTLAPSYKGRKFRITIERDVKEVG